MQAKHAPHVIPTLVEISTLKKHFTNQTTKNIAKSLFISQ